MPLVLTLAPAETGTRVHMGTDLAVLGKIGEFGQPIFRKKADMLLEEFARHFRSVLVTRGSEGHVPPPFRRNPWLRVTLREAVNRHNDRSGRRRATFLLDSFAREE